MASLVAHLIHSPLAWFLTQLITTATYILVVAAEVTLAAAVLRHSSDTR